MKIKEEMYHYKFNKQQESSEISTVNHPFPSAQNINFSENSKVCEKFNAIFDNYFDFIKCFGSDSICSYFKVLDLNKLEACIDTDPYIIIKILNEDYRALSTCCSAFEQEYRRFSNLAHPNIIGIRGFDKKNKYCFLMMENLRGELLHDAIHLHHYNHPMPVKKSLNIIHNIASALDFAHSKNIFHGDINPSNVLLSHSGSVKLIDLGLASLFVSNEKKVAKSHNIQELKLNSTYASPETLLDETIDTQDDVFSLSCTAYEILTGCHPYQNHLATEAQNHGLKVKWHRQLSYKQWKALRHGLALNKKERTKNIREFISELNQEIISKETIKPAAALAASILCGVLVGQNLIHHSNNQSHQTTQVAYQKTSSKNNNDKYDLLSYIEPSFGERNKTARISQINSATETPASDRDILKPLKKLSKVEPQLYSAINQENQLKKPSSSKKAPSILKEETVVSKNTKEVHKSTSVSKQINYSKLLETQHNTKIYQNNPVNTSFEKIQKKSDNNYAKQLNQPLIISTLESIKPGLKETMSLDVTTSREHKASVNKTSTKKHTRTHEQTILSAFANQIDITNETNFLPKGERNSSRKNNSMNYSDEQSLNTKNQNTPHKIKAFATF